MESRFELTRRTLGATLCVLGVAMLVYAGAKYTSGALRADSMRRQWNEQQAQALVSQARARAGDRMLGIDHVAIGAPVARLHIPRIHLDEIVIEGVGDDELNAGPGHLPGSALPGMTGNSVISAHRDRHFRRLDELQLGDTIRTETGHSTDSWVIVERRIVGRATPALFGSKQRLLTLTTCWPVRYFGDAPDRLILSARPAGASQRSSLAGSS